MVINPKLFPSLLILLDICAAMGYWGGLAENDLLGCGRNFNERGDVLIWIEFGPAFCGTCMYEAKWIPYGYFCDCRSCPAYEKQIRPLYVWAPR